MFRYMCSKQEVEKAYPALIEASGIDLDPETLLVDCTICDELEGVYYVRPGVRDWNKNRPYPPTEQELDLWHKTFTGATLDEVSVQNLLTNEQEQGIIE